MEMRIKEEKKRREERRIQCCNSHNMLCVENRDKQNLKVD